MSEWTGILHLSAEEKNGKTIANRVYFQGAYKVMRPVYHDESGQVCYYILNPGGGYLDGDKYQMKISLEKKARLILTTQSATKIYKSPHSYAYQESEFNLKDGSCLEYIPDPLIGYKDARYKQKNIIRMEKGCTLFYSDIITPGWSPEGDKFSYNMLQLINEIYMENELAVYDHIKLIPTEQNMDGLGLMEGYSHLGSMIIINDKVDSQLLDRIYQAISSHSQDFKLGLSELPIPGFTIRILANQTQLIERIFSDIHNIVYKEWYDRTPSFLRKY